MSSPNNIETINISKDHIAELDRQKLALISQQQIEMSSLEKISRGYNELLAYFPKPGTFSETKYGTSTYSAPYVGEWEETYSYQVVTVRNIAEESKGRYAYLAIMNYILKSLLQQPITDQDLEYLSNASEYANSLNARLLLRAILTNPSLDLHLMDVTKIVSMNQNDFEKVFLPEFYKLYTKKESVLCDLQAFAKTFLEQDLTDTRELHSAIEKDDFKKVLIKILNAILGVHSIDTLQKTSLTTLLKINEKFLAVQVLYLLIKKYQELGQTAKELFEKFIIGYKNISMFLANLEQVELLQPIVDSVFYMYNPELFDSFREKGIPKDIQIPTHLFKLYIEIAMHSGLQDLKSDLTSEVLKANTQTAFWEIIEKYNFADEEKFFNNPAGKKIILQILSAASVDNKEVHNFFRLALRVLNPIDFESLFQETNFFEWYQLQGKLLRSESPESHLFIDILAANRPDFILDQLLNDQNRDGKLYMRIVERLPVNIGLMIHSQKQIDSRLIDFINQKGIKLDFEHFLRVCDKKYIVESFDKLAFSFRQPLCTLDLLRNASRYAAIIDVLYDNIQNVITGDEDHETKKIYSDIMFIKAKQFESEGKYGSAAGIYEKLFLNGYKPITEEDLTKTHIACQYYAQGEGIFGRRQLSPADVNITRMELNITRCVYVLLASHFTYEFEEETVKKIIESIEQYFINRQSDTSLISIIFAEHNNELKYSSLYNTPAGVQLIKSLAVIYSKYKIPHKELEEFLKNVLRTTPKALNEFFVGNMPNPGAQEVFNTILDDPNKPETYKYNLINFLYRNQVEYCFEILLSTDEKIHNSDLYAALWNNLPEYVDKLIYKDQFALLKPLILEKKAKLQYKYVVGKIPSPNIIEIMPLFGKITADQKIRAVDNPIILAARFEELELFKYAYDHRNEEPWTIYWQQAGDSDCSVLTLMLKLKYDIDENNAMCNFIFNLPHVIQNINYTIVQRRKLLDVGGTADQNASRKITFERLLAKILPVNKYNQERLDGESSADYAAFALMVLRYTEALERQAGDFRSLTEEQMQSRLNAHKNQEEEKAREITRDNFSNVFNLRYSNIAELNRIREADADLRLLMLKQFIEDEPASASVEQHAAWVDLINLCGMQEYYQKYIDNNKQFIPFSEFKAEVVRLQAKGEAGQNVMGLVSGDNRNNPIRDLIYTKDLSGHSKLSWRSVDAFDGASLNFSDPEVHKFTLFCMILATENIDALLAKVRSTHAIEDLFDLIRFSQAPQANELKDSLSSMHRNRIAFNSDEMQEFKEKVKKCLLSDQQLMQTTIVTEADIAVHDQSCRTGIYTRYVQQVLNIHHEFSTLNDRMLQIGLIIEDRFAEFLRERIKAVLIQRLRSYNPHTRRISSLLKPLGAVPSNMLLEVTIGKILAAIRKPGVNLSNISDIVKQCCKDDIDMTRTVISIMTDLPLDTDFNEYNPLLTDPKIKQLFDMACSVTTDNWADIVVGARSIPKYSDAMGTDKITLAELDTRSKLLFKCFGSLSSKRGLASYVKPRSIYDYVYAKLKDKYLKKCDPISPEEHAVIKYLCTFIAPAKGLHDMADIILRETKGITSAAIPVRSPAESSDNSVTLDSATTQEAKMLELDNPHLIAFYNQMLMETPNIVMAQMFFRKALLYHFWQGCLASKIPEFNTVDVVEQLQNSKDITDAQLNAAIKYILTQQDSTKDKETFKDLKTRSLSELIDFLALGKHEQKTQIDLLKDVCSTESTKARLI